jgi:hypothetical protein
MFYLADQGLLSLKQDVKQKWTVVSVGRPGAWADVDPVSAGVGEALGLTQQGRKFKADGTGINYQTLINEFGDELLYNDIVTESPAGGPFNATDTASQALYQSQQYAATDLLNSTASEVEALGQYLLGKYRNPVLRFTGVTTQLAALSTAHQNVVLALDLTDIATVEKTYVTGTPASVTQTLIVSGVQHTITPQNHIIGFTFESTDGNQYLTLDDLIFGTLDNNLLSF